MRVGIPTEVKNSEYRVSITPAGVDALAERGHEVRIQSGAGAGSGIADEAYVRAGASIVDTAAEAWDAELVLKVKEPVAAEYGFLQDQVLFTYLHLAADPALASALQRAGTTAVAYETVQLPDRSLPLLAPMSEVAGRLSIAIGAQTLLRTTGGRGVLLGGIAGTPNASVVVIGGGVAGEHAAASALGMGADVTVIDISLPRLRELERRFDARIRTRVSNRWEISEQLLGADLVIGCALIPGAAAPKLVTDAMVSQMRPGSVLVDVAIDQGGCFEGSHPTTHEQPTFAVHGSIYSCIANLPGAVPATSTAALTNATLPYITAIANLGWDEASSRDRALAQGLNVASGTIVNSAVAAALAG